MFVVSALSNVSIDQFFAVREKPDFTDGIH